MNVDTFKSLSPSEQIFAHLLLEIAGTLKDHTNQLEKLNRAIDVEATQSNMKVSG